MDDIRAGIMQSVANDDTVALVQDVLIMQLNRYEVQERCMEVVSLDISDIDFERIECAVLGKGNKERKVYLTEAAASHEKSR